jgi:hypothetical protein
MYDALHGLGLEKSLRPGANYGASVPLPDGFWVDFDFYKRVLSEHTGTRVLRGDWVTLVREWTDASKSGVGVSVLQNDEQGRPLTQLQFLSGVWPRHLQLNSSNWRELRTILYSLQRAHAKQQETGTRALDGTVLYVYTDNSTSASVINRGTSTSPELLRLVRGIRELESLLGCHVVAVWMPGSSKDDFSIVSQGTDGLSRGSCDEGAFAADAKSPLAYSPIDHACPEPEPALVQAVLACLPHAEHRGEVSSWLHQPHPLQPVVITPPQSLARLAIDQVLRWYAARHYTTGAALILPNNYASEWGRLAKNFTRVYFARAGQFRRPDDAQGTMVVLLILPHLDTSHNQARFAPGPTADQPLPDLSRYERHLDPTVRCTPADAHHPQAALLRELKAPPPPQLPLSLLQQHQPPSMHAAVVARQLPTLPTAHCEFPERAAQLLCSAAFLYLVRRDARSACQILDTHLERASEQLREWKRTIMELVAHAHAALHTPQQRVRIFFFRLPYYLWSDLAFGAIPALTSVPPRYRTKNYASAHHTAVYKEFDRLYEAGYVSGPFDPDSDDVWCAAPLGAVPKKDTDKPRIIIDMTESELNDFTNFIRFKYPGFADFLELAYPGCFYWKLDWTDAFLNHALYSYFRRFFAYEHPESGEFFRYNVLPFGWKLSPLYYSRLVHAYVDMLRCTRRFSGELVLNHFNTPVHHKTLPKVYYVRDGQVASSCDQYCDDGIGFSPSKAAGDGASREAAALVAHIGAQPKTTKTVPPTQNGDTILGLRLSTQDDRMVISAPPERLVALRAMLAEFEARHRGSSTGSAGGGGNSH